MIKGIFNKLHNSFIKKNKYFSLFLGFYSMIRNSKGSKLRDKVEDILSEHSKSELLYDKFSELVHELQTYQIELEMQNEELKSSWKDLEEAKLKYYDLFEFAPVGYFSLNRTRDN